MIWKNGCRSIFCISSFFYGLALFALLLVVSNPVLAQTNTPTNTNTPVGLPTFPPVGTAFTATPGANNYLCPDFPVYYEDVDLEYARVCRRCLTERPTPTKSTGSGLPEYDLPITALHTETNTPTGTITPATPDPLATYYPTITPDGFIASSTPPPFSFTASHTPSSTPTLTLTPTSTPVNNYFNFDDAFEAGSGWDLFYGSYSVNAPGFGFELHTGDEFRVDNPLAGGYEALGFTLTNLDGSVYVRTIEYDLYLPARGCVTDCGYHAQLFLNHSVGGLSGYFLGYGVSYGYPFFQAGYAEDVTTHHVLVVNDYVQSMEFINGQYENGSVSTHNNFGQDYIRHLEIDHDPFGFETATPTLTPTPTLTGTAFTPTPTKTPVGYIDCRLPFAPRDRSEFITANFDNFVGETCPFRIIPAVDLSALDDRLVSPPVDLCIRWIGMPRVNLWGQSFPIGFFIALSVIALFLRRIWQF